jgi:putative selenate reductase
MKKKPILGTSKMSDRFTPISIRKLLAWILAEEKEGTIFGVHRDLFYQPGKTNPWQMTRFGQTLDNPLGAAAGPHTQLSHNIILAWLCGARFIELKTVQTLDDLDIVRPCIDMADEGYNCEWSQELSLQESFNQYLDAWIIIHLLREKYGFTGHGSGPGFIFNMSLGYDLAGIQNKNVQQFLDKMNHCQAEKEKKLDQLRNIFPGAADISIPDKISDNVTLSTMHGCPPDEIEKIADYLMTERGLHTTVKLNPTLLGPDRLRQILNGQLAFDIEVPDEAFAHDLKYDDAVSLIKQLQNRSKVTGVDFGIKLSNTLETLNKETDLPETEKMVYMSGRSLHPLTVNVAALLQTEFDGQLDISFSGGADCFNFGRLVECGLAPVTVCTDLLKPGGYARLTQYCEELAKHTGSKFDENKSTESLISYAQEVTTDIRYKKEVISGTAFKGPRALNHFDCIKAPCVETCPVEQNVPGYMYSSLERTGSAFDVVFNRNPLPTITGFACDQPCRNRCVRNLIDNPLLIREIKRYIALNDPSSATLKPGHKRGQRAVVIGAGPSGLAFAFFAALEGFDVDVYEARGESGGMVADVIPSFRLGSEQIELDLDRLENLDINFHYHTPVDKSRFEELQKNSDIIYTATGAPQSRKMNIPGEDQAHVVDVLKFLSAVRKNESVLLKDNIAVIGGGNSALDAARTAKRLVGNQNEVVLVYRRSISEMPANTEEILAAQNEGIKIHELSQPLEIRQTEESMQLVCVRTRLGKKDASGRRRPVVVEKSEFILEFGTIIPAIGQQTALDFVDQGIVQSGASTQQTSIKNLYMGGDALRGPSSIIQAIADGRSAVLDFLQKSGSRPYTRELVLEKDYDLAAQQQKMAKRSYGPWPMDLIQETPHRFQLESRTLTDEEAQQEASRCLYCDEICNLCVSVCPNRANISYKVAPVDYQISQITASGEKIQTEISGRFSTSQEYQVANIIDFCNECGNCATFCPTKDAPYRDKPRISLTEAGFLEEDNIYFLDTEKKTIKYKNEGSVAMLTDLGDRLIFETLELRVELAKTDLVVQKADSLSEGDLEISTHRVAEMKVLLDGLGGLAVFVSS